MSRIYRLPPEDPVRTEVQRKAKAYERPLHPWSLYFVVRYTTDRAMLMRWCARIHVSWERQQRHD